MDKQLLLDTASVYIDVDITSIDTLDLSTLSAKLLGTTKGGLDFSAKAKVREIEFDGKMDRSVKGMERVTGWDVSVSTDSLELTSNVLTLSLLKKDTGITSTKFDAYKAVEGLLSDTDYHNILVVGKLSKTSDPIIIEVLNTYNKEGFNFKGKDKDESSYKMTFDGHYDSSTDETPFTIYNPKIA